MKLKELVNIMNIADVGLASTSIPGLLPAKKIDMFHLDTDPLLVMSCSRAMTVTLSSGMVATVVPPTV